MPTHKSISILESFPSNFKKHRDGWNRVYRAEFQKVLKRTDDKETLDRIGHFCGIEKISAEKVEKQILEDKSKAIELFTLYKFSQGKTPLIRDYLEKKNFSVDFKDAFNYVLDKYQTSQEDLVEIYIFSEWNKEKSGRIYPATVKIPKDYEEKIKSKKFKFVYNLSRKTKRGRRGYKFKYGGSVSFPEESIFMFRMQTSDTEKPDVTGMQRRRDMRGIFFAVNRKKNTVEIKISNRRVQDILQNVIEDVLDIKLRSLVLEEGKFNLKKFFSGILAEKSGDKIKILNMELRKTKLRPAVPLVISKKSFGADITPILEEFKDNAIIDLRDDILSIKSFWIEYSQIKRKVKIKEQVDYSIRLELNDKGLSIDKIQEITQKFHEQFGMPLNVDLPPNDIAKNRVSIIEYLLSDPQTYNLKEFHLEELKQLEDKGIINLSEINEYKCPACDNIFKESDDLKCPECEEMGELFYRKPKIDINEKGLRDYISNILKAEGFSVYRDTLRRKIGGKTLTLMKASLDEGEVYLFVASSHVTKSLINDFQQSYMPVLIIHTGSSINTNLIEEKLFTQIKLSEVYFLDSEGKLPSDYFKDRIEKQIRYSHELISKNARNSCDTLKALHANPGKYTDTDLEDSVYGIIKQIIVNSDQWGNKKRGKRIPDGLGCFLFSKSGRTYRRSVGWDCKLTTKDHPEINEEASKFRDYIHRLRTSPELRSYCKGLSFFAIISNRVAPDKFKTLAKTLNNMRKWKGTVILLNINALVALHELYNKFHHEISKNRDIFYNEFLLTLNGGKAYIRSKDKEYFSYVSEDEIGEMFTSFLKKTSSDKADVTKVREYMESDIFE